MPSRRETIPADAPQVDAEGEQQKPAEDAKASADAAVTESYQPAAARPAAVLSSATQARGFVDGLRYAARVAKGSDFEPVLTSVADDTQRLLDAIDDAERSIGARVRAQP